MTRQGDSPPEWIADGEKYALIGLDANVRDHLPFQELAPGFWVWTDRTFDVPPQWKEWLGSIRTEDIEGCNLVLVSKSSSQQSDVLDAENKGLKRRVWGFYLGLLLTSPFSPAREPIMLTGSRRGAEIDIRQKQDFEIPFPNLFRPYPPILAGDIRRAAQLGTSYESLNAAPPSGGAWRIFRPVSVYVEGRTATDILDRLHQYCRCIDGLILSEPGKAAKQFKSRTELFVGPGHHQTMGELYEIRSAVEHLHENRYLETFDRAVRLDLVKKEAIAEHVARYALARIIGDKNIWSHFANAPSLEAFWRLPEADRRTIWGTPTNPADALVGFDVKFISDGELGQQ
jgi:hypothetical protein